MAEEDLLATILTRYCWADGNATSRGYKHHSIGTSCKNIASTEIGLCDECYEEIVPPAEGTAVGGLGVPSSLTAASNLASR